MEDNQVFSWLPTLVGVGVGVISGVIANLVHRHYTYNNKPKLEICENLIKDFTNDEPIIRAKVINKGKNPVTDIKLVLYGVEYLDSDKKLKSIDSIAENYIDFLDKYDDSVSSECDYAYRASFRCHSKSIHTVIKEYDDYLLFVKGTDTFNSSMIAKYNPIDKNNIKDPTWKFDKCDTCASTKHKEIQIPTEDKINAFYNKRKTPESCPLVESQNNNS